MGEEGLTEAEEAGMEEAEVDMRTVVTVEADMKEDMEEVVTKEVAIVEEDMKEDMAEEDTKVVDIIKEVTEEDSIMKAGIPRVATKEEDIIKRKEHSHNNKKKEMNSPNKEEEVDTKETMALLEEDLVEAEEATKILMDKIMNIDCIYWKYVPRRYIGLYN